jgi:hypothetical protein
MNFILMKPSIVPLLGEERLIDDPGWNEIDASPRRETPPLPGRWHRTWNVAGNTKTTHKIFSGL